jgi:hypothetical protein
VLIAVSTQSVIYIFRGKFPDVSPSYVKTVYNFVGRFLAAGFILERKRACRKQQLKIRAIGAGLATSASLMAISVSSARNVTKLLHLLPCKIYVVCRLLNSEA